MLLLLCALPVAALAHGDHGTGSPQGYSEGRVWLRALSALLPQAAAAARVEVDTAGGYRHIRADGLADHTTGQFPNRHNPNAIRAQDYRYRVPQGPQRAARPVRLGHNAFGVAVNGVPFDPATDEWWNRDRRSGWNIEALSGAMNLGLDGSNAHVQPNGAYHYHGLPLALLERLGYRNQPALTGYAADGFPIYGPYGYRQANDPKSGMTELRPGFRLKPGERGSGPGGQHDGTYSADFEWVAGAGDLDECNGRTGVTPEYPQGTYYYMLTREFPHVPRCFMGTPDASFSKGGPGGGPGPGPGMMGGGGPGGGPDGDPRAERRGPPAEALAACAGASEGRSCRFQTPHGEMQGECRVPRGELLCVPAGGRRSGGPPL
jgi:hypothetical protein